MVLDQSEIDTLIRMDATALGVLKPRFLYPCVSGGADRTTFVKRDQRVVTGSCSIRTCKSGTRNGPLIADSAVCPKQLLAHAGTVVFDRISMDIPDTSFAFSDLCQSIDSDPVSKPRGYIHESSVRLHTDVTRYPLCNWATNK